MFPDNWSLRKVKKIINKGYLIALKKGKGENVKIPLNEILGASHYGGIRIQYWMNGNTKQPYAHADILY